MRTVTTASFLLSVMGCVTTLAACASPEPAAQKDETKNPDVALTATAEGPDGDLTMKGAPADPGYVGVYPNPQRWSAIHFFLRGDGVPVTRCVRDGVEQTCSETPFFVAVKANRAASTGGVAVRSFGVPSGSPSGASDEPPPDSSGDSTGSGESAPAPAPAPSSTETPPMSSGATVEVTDTTGKVVATKQVETSPAPSPAPAPSGGGAPAPAGNTCGNADAMGGSPGRGGFAKNGETQACASASLGDTPGCDMTTVAAAAKAYCDAVNAQLPAGDMIDCSVLTNPNYVPAALPASRTGGDCSTYWEPARAAIDAYTGCAKVKLLLTQWRDRSRHELISNGVCTSSPLILDLDGDGIHLSSLEQGVKFDLLGAGQNVQASWTDGKDALLALDRNGNGRIDGAAELFGNATAGQAFADGFAALADLDDDGNGTIDARDRAFGHLLVWRDADRDGVSTPAELMTLAEAGVRRLSVAATRVTGPSSLDAHRNEIPLVAEFERRDGTRGALVDAFLRYKPLP